MLIATWNINSITVRLETVIKWLETVQPDVLCLQETKIVNEKFPEQAFQNIGYYSEFIGQPSYNGVAIISKLPVGDIQVSMSASSDDYGKRFIKANIKDTVIINTYIPNGQAIGSEKFAHKLVFLENFQCYLSTNYKPTEKIIWCGDFNIAPNGIDTFNANLTDGQIMCSEMERSILKKIGDWGFIDTFRLHNQGEGHFSWWDYRSGAFRRNLGYRIDHIWTTTSQSSYCLASWIDKNPRKLERPSDHAPVLAKFSF